VWGKIQPLRGRELFLAQQVNAEITSKVTIRYYGTTTVTPEHRVYFGARILEIITVINPDERNESLELLCKEVV